MGLLDFLFDKEQSEKKKLAKMQKTITNMYVQPTERQYVLAQLRDLDSEDAFKVLLMRFNESSHNSTVDLEEKQFVFDTAIEMARQNTAYVKILRDHIADAVAHINWPLKVLHELYNADEMAALLTELLQKEQTEYQRDPEKKQEIILRAAEFSDEDLAREIIRFLDDANETIRFLAVETLIAQNFDFVQEGLRTRIPEEESLRIIQRIALAFSRRHQWLIPEDEREKIANLLPSEYAIAPDGHIQARR